MRIKLIIESTTKNPSSFEEGFIFNVLLKNFHHQTSIFQQIYHTLISTSTPEGSSNFIRASTVLDEEE